MRSTQHIIDRIPSLEKEGMYVEYENLANALVDSGLMRVDGGAKANFARWADANTNVSLMISKEELEEPLLQETKKKLSQFYNTEDKIEKVLDNCRAQIKKLLPIEKNTLLILARILVQSAHPIIFRWILLEKVEIFISYSNEIGDVMDIQTWKHSGKNSGMQSTDGRDAAIFVSTGGDPLSTTDPEVKIYGDGWPAIARMQIIAGQELGHYADIKRDKYGRQIGRYSANFACTIPSPEAKTARLQDISLCKNIRDTLVEYGMDKLIHHESTIAFYRDNKIRRFSSIYNRLMAFIYKRKLLKLAKKPEWFFLKKFYNEIYMGRMIDLMIEDMESNLTPKADVYKREDKDAEEAIACAESLARVPQQANKWGHLATSATMHNLYKIYYNRIIPDLIEIYQIVTEQKYIPDLNKIPYSFRTKMQKLLNIFKKKDLPYRDLPK